MSTEYLDKALEVRDPKLQMDLLSICVYANVPAILWGLPGIGKTATIEGITKHLGMILETVIISQLEPSDIGGQPYVVEGRLHHLSPEWARQAEDRYSTNNERTLIFFDELDKAPMACQNAALRVIRDRVVGSRKLPSTTRMLAAANPPDMGGWDLPAPMANRFMHIVWGIDAQTVIKGLTTDEWPNPPIIAASNQMRQEEYRATQKLFGAFLARRAHLLHNFPKEAMMQGKAWPSPRSWEMAIRLHATVACLQDATPDERKILYRHILMGTVGQSVAAEFMTWYDAQDLIDPEDVLRDPLRCPIPDRMDRIGVITEEVVAALRAELSQDRFTATLLWLNRLAENGDAPFVMKSLMDVQRILKESRSGGQRFIAPPPEQLQSLMSIAAEAKMMLQPAAGRDPLKSKEFV